jgi:hypothetical protein
MVASKVAMLVFYSVVMMVVSSDFAKVAPKVAMKDSGKVAKLATKLVIRKVAYLGKQSVAKLVGVKAENWVVVMVVQLVDLLVVY